MSPPPPTIDLCPRCQRSVLFNAWCFACGYRGPGVEYTRAVPPGDQE